MVALVWIASSALTSLWCAWAAVTSSVRAATAEAPPTMIRCEHYLGGSFRRGSEAWPVLSLRTLVESPAFLHGSKVQNFYLPAYPVQANAYWTPPGAQGFGGLILLGDILEEERHLADHPIAVAQRVESHREPE